MATAGLAIGMLLSVLDQTIVSIALPDIGAGALFAVPTIALAELFPVELRGRVQGAVGAIFAIAAVGGPQLGGLITDTVGWRWIFYINVPLGALAAVLVALVLRLPRPEHRAGSM
ncbi:MFS transporter [Nocardia cyriacigeorgica]|uniref:MFS transporter n=1 Tax=Nocardia cyriacigeorgica TaxID=135487 RepID=UPI0018954DA9|nr:MFS transporter [Nocardia cyriacigeorgica]MBF6454674.1 MFS transporter [Nocardia cyriacigeorgica]MBF6477093.1 MFS transporter [Nocardia cyriacigeorgica]MBF6552568.1 MFS transporter [Nocardia cyriacigeorgica]